MQAGQGRATRQDPARPRAPRSGQGALRVASVLALAPSPRQGRARAALGRRHRLQPIHRCRTQRSKADPHGPRCTAPHERRVHRVRLKGPRPRASERGTEQCRIRTHQEKRFVISRGGVSRYPSPSTASPTPATTMPTSASRSCTPSQDPADRAHTPTETARIRAGPSNPAGLSLAPDPPKRTPRA